MAHRSNSSADDALAASYERRRAHGRNRPEYDAGPYLRAAGARAARLG